jgi:hypothetical protein
MTNGTGPALLVAIDTESDNQWDATSRRHPTFDNIYALERLHQFFQRLGVRPTYVVTHPVACDPQSSDVLRRLVASGDCEIGAHHHAWETPPCEPADADRHQYALSLPLDQFGAQLESLAGAIVTHVGVRPVSYRSGRFGLSAAHVSPLEQQGFRVDSSVSPLFYEAHKGGPDFVGAPPSPYFLSYDDAAAPGTSEVLELPVSAALNRRVPDVLARWYGRAPWPYTTRRVLRLAGLAHVRWLRPSYSSTEDMMALARDLVSRRVPLLNLIFHSSEAIAGTSPYNRTDADLAAFFDRLERFLRFATRELGAKPMTLTEFRQAFTEAPFPAAGNPA